MAVNKYGNDFRNNIMWNKEYPFIPKITNDFGLTIHENDIFEYYNDNRNKYIAIRIIKIYSKDLIWARFIFSKKNMCDIILNANEILPHIHSECIPPKCEIDEFDNQGFTNWLEYFLGSCFSRKYPTELNLPNDWHFDKVKYEAKRLEEVEALKNKN